MSNGYAALVLDFTLSQAQKTTASSLVQLNSLTLTTSCLLESSYVFPGWENVPIDGYPPAKNISVTVF